MASVDTAFVYITGKGGHGATPHECVDPVVAVVGMVQAIQTIIPRNVYALDEAVLSVSHSTLRRTTWLSKRIGIP